MEQTKAVKTVKKGRMIAGVVFFILTALCFVLATAVMADAFKLWEDPNVGTALALIAVIPSILFSFTGNQLISAFGGTSILIMIGVALDTMSKIESQLKMHNYEGFFK